MIIMIALKLFCYFNYAAPYCAGAIRTLNFSLLKVILRSIITRVGNIAESASGAHRPYGGDEERFTEEEERWLKMHGLRIPPQTPLSSRNIMRHKQTQN